MYFNHSYFSTESCTLVCGDDKGTLWIYDLANYVNGQIKSPLFDNISIDQIDPHLKLDWPELDDAEVGTNQFN